MKKFLLAGAAILTLAACSDDAQVASRNLSKAADNFEIDRRIVALNGITGSVMMTVEGKCSINDDGRKLAVTCKIGEGRYIKNFIGLSDNVTYVSEQIIAANVSTYHYRRTFKPQTVIPDIDFRGSASAAGKALTPDSSD